jgi:hypothetical protein
LNQPFGWIGLVCELEPLPATAQMLEMHSNLSGIIAGFQALGYRE